MRRFSNLLWVSVFIVAFCQQVDAQEDMGYKEVNCQNSLYLPLMAAMEAGEYDALVKFMRCRHSFQGGNLGDLYRSAGLFLEKDPYIYGYILEHENAVEWPDLENFFEMLPLIYVDDIENKKEEIVRRIGYVQGIEDPRIRTMANDALQAYLERLNLAQKGLDKK